MEAIRCLVRSMRLPFLSITVVSVFLGAAVVAGHNGEWNGPWLAAVLTGALLAHVAVNLLNEYQDFRSALDFATVRTPFSGGSGALVDDPGMARTVLVAGIVSLLGTGVIGLILVGARGWGIVPIGLLGLLIVAAYTPWINRYPLACLVSPGAGVGVLTVVGTQYILEGAYRPGSWLASLVPFFLANNLLLLNQYPDIEADAAAGRRHFPIAYGVRAGNIVYGVFAFAAMTVIVTGVMSRVFPPAGLSALLPMPLAFVALAGAAAHGRHLGAHPRYLAANAAAAVFTPLILGLSFFLD